ncbi:hypothetical protein Pst134EA_003135 [Puccinia striiformis f. sp. tritici]|uniref:Uncharacterized protein n=1 Tax=Puccinia striiformis f. sp. tritici PST-78 TaxID=1165861 RepID=A0A0L0W4V6_9BASI|nr:hypothetical protein Pst134EA_003135 [Puccinia striiformis f. sp. tritici]KAH9464673.1 hypothetical protein Pst134EB_004192 [Puccinia striiformis f. sp. tritici]KAH9472526.1 hypothetical protein Pst134EA_003135 [Puccinia striiformis f. sp. tritici]KAI9631567.1 hypothetical protein KEM48_014217 [Puccinia striiformis f. sp. tritici PST-130]KNF06556.1 hypothetical protein PSTG_00429 [Puccinia striiformis f. sp. tritici PST-78]
MTSLKFVNCSVGAPAELTAPGEQVSGTSDQGHREDEQKSVSFQGDAKATIAEDSVEVEFKGS